MVCIEKRPYTLYGRLATLHFRYLTCLLDRGHITGWGGYFFVFLSERITTSVITSINTSVYVRRSEKVSTPIASFQKRLKANRLP